MSSQHDETEEVVNEAKEEFVKTATTEKAASKTSFVKTTIIHQGKGHDNSYQSNHYVSCEVTHCEKVEHNNHVHQPVQKIDSESLRESFHGERERATKRLEKNIRNETKKFFGRF